MTMFNSSRGRTEISICEVRAFFYKAGDVIEDYEIDETNLWLKDIETHSEYASKEKLDELRRTNIVPARLSFSTDSKGGILLLEDNIGFAFSFFGENADDTYSSGVEADCRENSFEVLEPFLEDLAHDARTIREKFDKFKKPNVLPITACRFLVLWKYESWGGYEDDFDSEIDYVGLVNSSKISSLVDSKKV